VNSYEIFEYYRTQTSLNSEDMADFHVYTQDPVNTLDGMMAIAGLTINLLENPWNEDNLTILLTACDGISNQAFERIVVGLLLTLMVHDQHIRHNQNLLDDIQEILTFAPELSFTALCNIARTTQVKRMEAFNMQLSQELMPLIQDRHSNEFYDIIRSRQSEMEEIARLHLDQNFLIFREFYHTPFFRHSAANWVLPWSEDALLSVKEEDRSELESLLDMWPLCDSDKYALCHTYDSFKGIIQSQLSVDSLREVGLDMPNNQLVTNGYVQQLYRYFRLSSHTQSRVLELLPSMRDMMVYRLVVVGERAKREIDRLLV
jgi:hypothetical protein